MLFLFVSVSASHSVGVLEVQAMAKTKRRKVVTLGSDCAGWESLSRAAKALGLPHRLVFASESDRSCRSVIQATIPGNYLLFDDIAARVPSDVGTVDIYGAGFPCQPFSSAGSCQGSADPRASPVSHILQYIRIAQPKGFMLENVPALLHKPHQQLLKHIINTLRNIKGSDKKRLYNMDFRLLNTKDLGLPQNRSRLWIVGWQHELAVSDFKWPPLVKMAPLRSVLSPPSRRPTLPTSECQLKMLLLGFEKMQAHGLDLDEDLCAWLRHGRLLCRSLGWLMQFGHD